MMADKEYLELSNKIITSLYPNQIKSLYFKQGVLGEFIYFYFIDGRFMEIDADVMDTPKQLEEKIKGGFIYEPKKV